MKFSEILEINGNKLTKKYIESLSFEERETLVDPIFNEFRKTEFLYPDDIKEVNSDYQRLLDYNPDTSVDSIYGNSSMATSICKYFCHEYFSTTEKNKKTMIELFNDDKCLKLTIINRLGMDWLKDSYNKKGDLLPGVNEAFNLSFKMILQGLRSRRAISQISQFKPEIAKLITMKYSNPGDTVFDPSCGFGARLLGCMSSNRKYIGTDPLTTESLEKMANHFNFDKNNYKLIKSGSEHYCGEENSIDFSYSSIPYYSQEYYSKDESQAYNKGEDYFYNVYWRDTVKNVKHMLKPGKLFGVNITDKYPKIVSIAKEYFGEPVEVFKLRLVRSHLTKKKLHEAEGLEAEKYEPIYMFKNNK
jgi:hypothetical protein